MRTVYIYDSTLRDGAQCHGISFSVEDKLKIVQKLDKLGVNYIEAGNPGSNPKEIEFFKRVKKLELRSSKIVAFGSTRRFGTNVFEDVNIASLLKADTDAIAIFGKAWDFQVTDILKTTLEENLNMIFETVKFFKDQGKELIFDSEHFFDGYLSNPEYALETLRAARDGGADNICLCDTNGGTFPEQIYTITSKIIKDLGGSIGIHCHNDTGMAVANSIMAVKAGVDQVQGTFNGIGERCGNANLSTIIPNLQIKMDCSCIPDDKLEQLTSTARFMSEVANTKQDDRSPYIGKYAFAHKAGMHADAVYKNPIAYEHVSPNSVGNERVFLMSEVAGRSAVLGVINQIDNTITKDSPQTKQIIKKLKEMEYEGYQYEGAEGSLELLIRKELGKYRTFFGLNEFKVIANEPAISDNNSTAVIKIKVGDIVDISGDEGDGPVNALDRALRKSLEKFYPEIAGMKLTDYKVRVLDSDKATAAKVRVLIESTDGEEVWTTIGVSTDIIAASWKALVDSVEYKLNRDSDIFKF